MGLSSDQWNVGENDICHFLVGPKIFLHTCFPFQDSLKSHIVMIVIILKDRVACAPELLRGAEVSPLLLHHTYTLD